jgi:hypothetical protein
VFKQLLEVLIFKKDLLFTKLIQLDIILASKELLPELKNKMQSILWKNSKRREGGILKKMMQLN